MDTFFLNFTLMSFCIWRLKSLSNKKCVCYFAWMFDLHCAEWCRVWHQKTVNTHWSDEGENLLYAHLKSEFKTCFYKHDTFLWHLILKASHGPVCNRAIVNQRKTWFLKNILSNGNVMYLRYATNSSSMTRRWACIHLAFHVIILILVLFLVAKCWKMFNFH